MPLASALLLLAAVDTAAFLDGPLLPEGADWNAPGAAILADTDAAITIPLARTLEARALLVQADFDDTYLVEASDDGASWRVLWRVPALAAPPGLRSRWTRLRAPERFRFVRVRATSGAGFSVSRLRLYERVPAEWPPRLDLSLPGRGAPLFPSLTPPRVAALRAAVAGLGFCAVLLAWTARHGGDGRGRRRASVALGAAALAAALSWTHFLNFHFTGFVHFHELFHYYVGAKYFPELGYDGLYECVALADREDGVASVEDRPIRDLRTDRLLAAAEALRSPPACRARFDAARWSGFRRDVAFFRGRLAADWWRAQTDHGYNATPVWTLTGRLLAAAVPATPVGARGLALLDLGLLALAALLVARHFGFDAACVAVVFFGANGLASFAWTGGALLRYDWLFLAAAGLVALRAGRPALGGFALAWSALLRVFPGVLFAGIALKALADAAVEGPRVALRRLRPTLLGAAAAVLLLVPSSLLVAGGGAWEDFARNSRKYLGTPAENKLGLATALAFRPENRAELLQDPLRPDPAEDWTRAQAEATRRIRPVQALLALVFAGLLLAAARGRPAWVAAALAAGLLPVLFQQANYYYGLLAAFALVFESVPGVGLGLVALAWATNLAGLLWSAWDVRGAVLSALVALYVYWAVWRVSRSG
ncbi:MAG TPA: hypothetical protein VFM88_07425 [Vicinamibacteria bacterium]|nr:hypothetical protein [Vicinamibacteria bacterium]